MSVDEYLYEVGDMEKIWITGKLMTSFEIESNCMKT